MTGDKAPTMQSSHAGSRSTTAAAAAAQVLSRLADLARTTMRTEASLAKQSVDLTWATLAGDLDRASVNKAYVKSVAREGAQYWRAVVKLGVDYATDLVNLGTSLSTTVLRDVAAAGRKSGTKQEKVARAPRSRRATAS